MARIDLAPQDNGEVWREFCQFMGRQSACKEPEQPGMALGGAITDNFWIKYRMPSGECVEVAFDGFVGTSIAGEDELVERLAALFAKGRDNG